MVTLSYKLPSHPTAGKWVIRVEALTQTFDQTFYVEQFYLPLFEVLPYGPAYVLDSQETYSASFTTAFHSHRVSHGNATTRVYAKRVDKPLDKFTLVHQETVPWAFVLDYNVQLKEVQQTLGVTSLVGWVIRVEMTLNNFFMGEERQGYIETRIIKAQLRLTFTGTRTAVFKPGLPFEGHVYVMHDDEQNLPEEKLAQANLVIQPVITTANGQTRALPNIVVPRQGEYLQKSATSFGFHDLNEFNWWMVEQSEDSEYHQFRTSGIHRFQVCLLDVLRLS